MDDANTQAVLGCLLVMASAWTVLVVAECLKATGWWVSQVSAHARRVTELQAQGQAAQLNQSQTAAKVQALQHHQDQLNDLQARKDKVMAHWPNSAIRMPLLSQLQQLAMRQGLELVLLKSWPLPDALGFDSAAVQFHFKGSEAATYAYWQTVDRIFSNGRWASLSWELGPDGLYVFQAQLHLWWDVQDADTDTGVAVRWDDVLARTSKLPKVSSEPDSGSSTHVFPDQSHAQMKVVGVAQKAPSLAQGETAIPTPPWVLVKAGHQVLPVKPGDVLGLEKVSVQGLDAQGLWVTSQAGQLQSRVAWERGAP